GGNDYPRVLMGSIAHCRQTLLDAGYYQRQWEAFDKAGRVGRRPPFDPALADLGPVLARKQPVGMEADSCDEIHRALDFASEFKLQPILAGGRAARKALDRLQQQHVPLILKLNFTDAPSPRPSGTSGRRGLGGSEAERDLPSRVRAD